MKCKVIKGMKGVIGYITVLGWSQLTHWMCSEQFAATVGGTVAVTKKPTVSIAQQ